MTASIFLGPGEGETIRDDPERFSQIRADLEQVTILDFHRGPGQKGPELHVHDRHADCFYVYEGVVTFLLGPDAEPVHGPAGTLVVVPPLVVHTFANQSPEPARLINIHAPNMGFADYMRGTAETFDTREPPADGGRPMSDALVSLPGEGQTLELGPSRGLLKASVNDDRGWLALIESTVSPGSGGPVLHRHREMVDSFWVMEGTLTLHIEDRVLEAPAGSFALAAPGTPHTFSNPGDAPVRFLSMMFPAGFEQYLVEAATAGRALSPEEMGAIAAKYDFEPA